MNCKRGSQYSLYAAWLIAIIATGITLVLSEIMQMPVCHLCWYQRICLYPLVVILAIAVYRNDNAIATYTVPLSIIGALFAIYQYLEQMVPGFAPINFCTQGPDCSDIHLKLLGFITLPFLSIIVFLIIAALLIMAKSCCHKES